MTTYHVIREAGRWSAGRWLVHHTQICDHRHRTVEAARACLRWPGVRISTRDYREDHFGQIVGDDGSEVHVRPDRFHETTATFGRVTATRRRWNDEAPDLDHPEWKYELEIRCGEWAMSFVSCDAAPVSPEAWAAAAHLLLVNEPPGVVVARIRAMQRQSDEERESVVVIGPWKRSDE